MKNKKVTYLLGFVVVSIWLVVFFRLYHTFFAPPTTGLVANEATALGGNSLQNLTEDSIKLLLDYGEPFSFRKDKPATSFTGPVLAELQPLPPSPSPTPGGGQSLLSVSQPVRPPQRKKAFAWETIKYKGMVGGGEKVAIIKYNGNTRYLRQKDKLDSALWVWEIQADYILLKHTDSTKTIPIGN